VQTTLSKLWLFVLSERTVDPEFFVLGPVVRLLDTKRPLAPEEPEDTSRASSDDVAYMSLDALRVQQQPARSRTRTECVGATQLRHLDLRSSRFCPSIWLKTYVQLRTTVRRTGHGTGSLPTVPAHHDEDTLHTAAAA
jgi:hypothetical protein